MTTLVNQGDDDTLMQLVDAPTSLFLDGVDIEREDIRPIAQMATNALVVVVPGDSEYADVAELMEDVAGDANIGTPGTVESREAAKWTEMAQAAGVEGDLNFVTSNGVDAIIPEVISGRQEAVMLVPTVASGYLESGELKAVAVTSDERLEAFPDVPTLVESGIDTTFYRPQGVALPATASPEAAEFWEERLEEISEDPEWQGFLEDNGYIPEYKGSDEYTEWIDAEMAEYKQYFDSLGGGEGS
jgi:putative tricarboxylic transport membrane protein